MMNTTKRTENFKIRKTIRHAKGKEVILALDALSGKELPTPIFVEFNDNLKKWEFYAEELPEDERKKDFAIGTLEEGDPDVLESLSEENITYTMKLTGHTGNIMDAVMTIEETEMVAAVKEEVKTDDLLDQIVSDGIMTKEDIKERLDWAKDHRIPAEAIRQVAERFWTKAPNKPVSKPKTLYINDNPRSESASIVALAILAILTRLGGILFEGDKSVGKNVCAESIAWFLNRPYFMITFTRGMTSDDIFGTKATDNSASSMLSEDLAAAYLYVQHFPDASEELREKAARYEYLKAKAASVSIVQEESCFIEWLKNGGVMSFNEMNLAEANFFASFTNQITDTSGFIDVPGHGRIDMHPECVLIGTQNADYTGVCEQNEATMSRFGCIQFPYPKSIKNQLKATVGKDRLDAKFFNEADALYKTFHNSVKKGMVENSCLNIRGFIRALSGVAQVPGLSTLAEQIKIHVVDTCPVDDRLSLMQQVNEKISL